MDNVEAVDMDETLENLAEEAPDFLGILEEITRYQISQSLSYVSFKLDGGDDRWDVLAFRSTPWRCT